MNLKSLCLNPSYIAPSSWWQHVPIAYWLIDVFRPKRVVELGTHYGVSFFAFCEASESFSPETFLYAIDTWEGDEHASLYDETVFDKVSKYHHAQHSTRSRLIRSSFDDALNYFEDASVDLLHIDGLHTYEAVKHDYESWIPKMAGQHIVVFHDINVRERNFGVWKLWQEIKTENYTYEVLNGHGLGILVSDEELYNKMNEFNNLTEIFKSRGENFEKIAQLTPGGAFGQPTIEHFKDRITEADKTIELKTIEISQLKQENTELRRYKNDVIINFRGIINLLRKIKHKLL